MNLVVVNSIIAAIEQISQNQLVVALENWNHEISKLTKAINHGGVKCTEAMELLPL